MKPPILIERLVKGIQVNDRQVRQWWYATLTSMLVAFFVLFIFAIVRDTVTGQDKECAAKYGSTVWDHRSGVNQGEPAICFNTETEEIQPAP